MKYDNKVSTDPIADMLARIRNAIAVNRPELTMPHSKAKETTAHLLAANGFLEGVNTDEVDGRKVLKISLQGEGTNSVITQIKRLSRPGRRMYVKSTEIPVVKRGRGIVIISTSSGVMTGNEARDKHLGGELICEVY